MRSRSIIHLIAISQSVERIAHAIENVAEEAIDVAVTFTQSILYDMNFMIV